MSKYHNIKTVIDGITFDSRAEANRWQDLKLLEKAGQISDLKRQVPYCLVPSVILDGRKKPAVIYKADFVYRTALDIWIIEDVKGVSTPLFRLKKHLMKHVHGIDIVEIKK
jgi:hypothetical protein